MWVGKYDHVQENYDSLRSHIVMKGTKVLNLAVVSKLFINSMPA